MVEAIAKEADPKLEWTSEIGGIPAVGRFEQFLENIVKADVENGRAVNWSTAAPSPLQPCLACRDQT